MAIVEPAEVDAHTRCCHLLAIAAHGRIVDALAEGDAAAATVCAGFVELASREIDQPEAARRTVRRLIGAMQFYDRLHQRVMLLSRFQAELATLRADEAGRSFESLIATLTVEEDRKALTSLLRIGRSGRRARPTDAS